jgi:hypothetical protein
MVAQYLFSDVYRGAVDGCTISDWYYNTYMSTLLEKAFEKARELPEPDQDIAASGVGCLASWSVLACRYRTLREVRRLLRNAALSEARAARARMRRSTSEGLGGKPIE